MRTIELLQGKVVVRAGRPRFACPVVTPLLLIAGLTIHAPVLARAQPLKQGQPRPIKVEPPSVGFVRGPVIPGLGQNAVPQGLAYAAEHDKIILSHYFENAPSCISILDNTNGKLVASVQLEEKPGTLHIGHVGGIAVVGDSLWVASAGNLWQYDLAPLVSATPPATATAIAKRSCETQTSFCTATSDQLFVGEFAYGKKYRTDPSHHLTDRKGVRKIAWACGYSRKDPFGKPQCLISIRQRVQGMCVTDARIFLSVSYGRRNRSTIAVYRNPLRESAHSRVKLRDGTSVPLWFLDGKNHLTDIEFPPMSEGIDMIGDRLAVLSESGAAKYQFGGKGPLDVLLLLDVSAK